LKDKNYDVYNIDKREERKVEDNRGRPKKRDKHWKKGSNEKRKHINNLHMDEEMLRIQNLTVCVSCDNVYHLSLDKCPYCKT
tara:strand:+ start:3386 stop:3631 length:246 start_codon:yes stop_codon:yes gene_type:complete